MNILTHKNKNYLILVDYHSNIFECEILKDLQSRTIIKACKKTFAKHGIPHQLQSDNGVQFISTEFSKYWGFEHTTSSLGHQQSNGTVDAAVNIIKRLMRRADDLYLTLLEYRNTPPAGINTSPAQRMFDHATRSILPTDSATQTSVIQQKVRRKLDIQKHYNKSTRN